MRFLQRRGAAEPERRYVRVPAENGVPADLPAWARDELVRRRLESSELRSEIMRLRRELDPGADPFSFLGPVDAS